jgi:hypothetical protein
MRNIVKTIQFCDNEESIVSQVKSIFNSANIQFEVQEPRMESILLGASGNYADIMSNLKLVSDEITVEFTGMGGYYTDAGIDALNVIIDEIKPINTVHERPSNILDSKAKFDKLSINDKESVLLFLQDRFTESNVKIRIMGDCLLFDDLQDCELKERSFDKHDFIDKDVLLFILGELPFKVIL